MGTRACIAVKLEDKTYQCVYLHWDGYPEHAGRILKTHYNSKAKANELLSHGDISSLQESMKGGLGHSFDSPLYGETTFYARDRGEDNCESQHVVKAKDLLRRGGAEHVYIFGKAGWREYGRNK